MSTQTKSKFLKEKQAYPSNERKAKDQENAVEPKEVVGRHKNDGQKDHKGAR